MDDYLQDLNFSDTSEEFLCYLRAEKESTLQGWCPWLWDSLLCWPASPPGLQVFLSCFAELQGIKYDVTQNASKWCYPNGTWSNYSDYTSCVELSDVYIEPASEMSTLIYFIGYNLSLIALFLAVWIFIYFKDLRCLRNTIHTNLMFTYICNDFIWILNYVMQAHIQADQITCIALIVVLHYFLLTNFFWMFVEGLYLYLLVVETFTGKNIKLRAYLLIGWGTPVLVVMIWGISRSIIVSSAIDSQIQTDRMGGTCTWMVPHVCDWIYQAPAIVVLAGNLVFLVRIMWVLITKLRSANNVETQQYRKATKALLVLIPLLGISYILLIAGPTEGKWAHIYKYLRAFLLSTQGFTVSLFYCFLNTEVQNTVRHHFERWKEARDLGTTGRRYTSYSKDWSPNTRTESIRLYNKHEPAPCHCKKRESTASETTTMTLIGGGGGSNRVSNGSMGATLSVRAPISPFLEAQMENAV